MRNDRLRTHPLLSIEHEALDRFLPLHLILDASGMILSAGPTAKKVFQDQNLIGQSLFGIVTVKRPRGPDGMDKIVGNIGRRMQVEVLSGTTVKLRAQAIRCSGDRLLISMSLASDFTRAINDLELKASDFSPWDSTVDLIFAMQLQTTLLDDSRALAEKIEAAKDAAVKQSMTDELTGLANRRALVDALDARLQAMEGSDRPFALLQIDLDRFKLVNDTLGHDAGDAVLRRAAQVMRDEAGSDAFVSRIGGDEFVVLLPTGVTQADIARVATVIIERVSAPIPYDGQFCQIGASIGITRPMDRSVEVGALLAEADLALYESKRKGRGRYFFFAPDMRSRLRDLDQLSTEIAQALDEQQFQPFFQPQVQCSDGMLLGFELLVRWQHPQRGLLAPAQFLYAAEQANLLHRIDKDVVQSAFEAVGKWRACGLDVPGLSLNITSTTLADVGFLDRLKWMCESADFPAEKVGLEILESVVLDDTHSALIDAINRLGEAGFKIHLDDFGTDRASISNLRRLRLDKIKVDRSFVTGIDREKELRVMTGAVLDLARRLGIETIAEGVGTVAEAQTVAGLGCDAWQGFLISRPLDRAGTEQWLRQGRRWSGITTINAQVAS